MHKSLHFQTKTRDSKHNKLFELTSCFSSSERALSIRSNIALHLTLCISAVASWENPSAAFFITLGSLPWLEENSFDMRKGSSVVTTARTFFLLCCSAANAEHCTTKRVMSTYPLSKRLIMIRVKEKYQKDAL